MSSAFQQPSLRQYGSGLRPQMGQAQSMQSQSRGTPYKSPAQPKDDGWNFAGGTPYFDESTGQVKSSSKAPYAAYATPTANTRSSQVTGDWQGGYAAAPASQRPQAFQMGVAQTPWGQSMDPFVERNAFVEQLNRQRIQNQIAFNSGGTTNPAAGLTPGLDFQKALQQAGLGQGAPSMAPKYGNSLISRLNEQSGGSMPPVAFGQGMAAPGYFGDITPDAARGGVGDNAGVPFRQGMGQQYSPSQYRPFVNQQGREFTGSMSFAPGTPQSYQNQAYGKWANQEGYFQPPAAQPPAEMPGGERNALYSPSSYQQTAMRGMLANSSMPQQRQRAIMQRFAPQQTYYA